jgi:hypothetical protein
MILAYAAAYLASLRPLPLPSLAYFSSIQRYSTYALAVRDILLDRAMGPWPGSMNLRTHRNYPRPHWTHTFDLCFSCDLPPLNSTSQIYLLLLLLR